MTRQESIRLKSIDCGTDSLAPGTIYEQIAACPIYECPLFEHRPLPRKCRKNGVIDAAAVATIIAKLKGIDERWAREGR